MLPTTAYSERTDQIMKIEITLTECNKLLDLLGHDDMDEDTAAPVVDLVRLLYTHFRALLDKSLLTSPLTVNRRQLFTLHKHFTPQTFGEGGREFRVKLAQAFTDLVLMEEGLNDFLEAIGPTVTDKQMSNFDKLNLDMYNIAEENK